MTYTEICNINHANLELNTNVEKVPSFVLGELRIIQGVFTRVPPTLHTHIAKLSQPFLIGGEIANRKTTLDFCAHCRLRLLEKLLTDTAVVNLA